MLNTFRTLQIKMLLILTIPPNVNFEDQYCRCWLWLNKYGHLCCLLQVVSRQYQSLVLSLGTCWGHFVPKFTLILATWTWVSKFRLLSSDKSWLIINKVTGRKTILRLVGSYCGLSFADYNRMHQHSTVESCIWKLVVVHDNVEAAQDTTHLPRGIESGQGKSYDTV